MEKPLVDRNTTLRRVAETLQWDLAVIGGGATGLGIAVDAASRGYRTILLEQHDFAKGTSSRSTKLVHGGVRYLAMGDIRLVYDALHERGILFRNAPHLAHAQSFIIPCYSFFSKCKYLIGLKIYDWLAGKYRIGKSSALSREETLRSLPGVKSARLQGGVRYFDGQFDDARMAVNLAQTAAVHGAAVLNYCQVTELSKDAAGKVTGLTFVDRETGTSYPVTAKAVINATGVFVDDILTMDTPNHKVMVRPSQGTHLVVDRTFLGERDALMIPKTSDGRVLFGVPWHNYLLLGTTDTPIKDTHIEPVPLDDEIAFILKTAADYLSPAPRKSDIRSMFAGLRPLAAPDDGEEATKEISRDHKLIVNPSGLITITGGKWTTYRKMAEETIDRAIETGALEKRACLTKTLKIQGHCTQQQAGHWASYGSDAGRVRALTVSQPDLAERLHPDFDYIGAEVVWAVVNEMARTLEDVLARRLRVLFLDAAKSMEMAPKVVALMAKQLNKNREWENQQLQAYRLIARQYLPEENLDT
ncbi:glycerol-3-phosphate dehydrogenase/oxidase [Parapedobacter lycopersici]|uniref:glycerol-3-phosphate dehydrogenase/oxidase n=1 Tax=Parapedobacter lycopersici TaxID=1864939 RepID=UPI00333E1B08